ncbi:hypothetical protein PTQ35_02180 [Campylobacter sp. 46490-21]|uniref:polysaccharide pyruvyl transferase family protein n=1 Tax=Campylobacter magnus TaxID=3026462 RepID=UPI00235F67DF|nr:polysaccharide pyruvyl transferase family protein [Campylobacter magnus]MDD0847619.1 hypothetical protein [Campylobacter magnus]
MMKQKVYYGILGYNSMNIGDEIQSIAAMRFLPSLDEIVYREQINTFIPKNMDGQTKLIMNAWWMHKPQNFPPSQYIKPLLISMHIRPEIKSIFLNSRTKEYLIKHGPVGCRDITTVEILQEEGIPAYFSGCLTATLLRNESLKREDYILCVDVPEKYVEEIRSCTNRPVYSTSGLLSIFYTFEDRLELARLILRSYHDAHFVISPRLHVITPCLAMNTPVLRLITEKTRIGDERYKGVEQFFNSIDEESFMDFIHSYDFDTPLLNPTKHIVVRDMLVQKCLEFTNFDSKKSAVNSNNPFIEMIRINKQRNINVKKTLYFTTLENIRQAKNAIENGFNQYDLIENANLNIKFNKISLFINKFFYGFMIRFIQKPNLKNKYLAKLKEIERKIQIAYLQD